MANSERIWEVIKTKVSIAQITADNEDMAILLAKELDHDDWCHDAPEYQAERLEDDAPEHQAERLEDEAFCPCCKDFKHHPDPASVLPAEGRSSRSPHRFKLLCEPQHSIVLGAGALCFKLEFRAILPCAITRQTGNNPHRSREMSHVVKVQLVITDLKVFEDACKEVGITFDPIAMTWRWYGSWMNDYNGEDAAYTHGIKPERYGHADAGIVRVPGCGYDIGVYKVPNEEGKYCLIYDYYCGGHGIEKALGKALPDLNKAYGALMGQKILQKKGFQARITKERLSSGRLDVKVLAIQRY